MADAQQKIEVTENSNKFQDDIRKNVTKHKSKYAVGMLALVFILGNYFSDASAEDKAENAAPAAPKIEVTTLKTENIRSWKEFSGRLEAVDRVQVRPRVGGTITKILFTDGQIVKAGDPLIIIDVRPYAAALNNAEANLASAKAQEQLAGTELGRSKKLIEKFAISQSAFDASNSGYKVSAAAIKSAEAAYTQAKLNLEYANITAPISGKISRAEFTVGNVIEVGGAAPVLTTIVSNDKLYAEFDVDEESYVSLFGKVKAGEEMPVELLLAGQTEASHKGKLYAFDNQINSESGTIRARAIFDNPEGILVPGMFAKVRLGTASKVEQLLVDEKSVGTDQNKKFVYVVSPENKVTYREVKLGDSVNGKRVVLDGLKLGEKVMVNSLQRVMPDMVVEPVEAAIVVTPAPATTPVIPAKTPEEPAKK